jgi:hypothetical protein
VATAEGSWRLKTIILLVILLTSIYYINSFFYNVDIDNDGYITDTDLELDSNLTDEGVDEGQGFIDILGNIGSYLTFGNIDNFYARLIINLFTTICWIIIGYIIYTFIRDWIPFVG